MWSLHCIQLFPHRKDARPFIIFDTLRRYLEYKGYKVNYVQNFTDIDDKIINKAKEEHTTSKAVADKYIKNILRMLKDLRNKRSYCSSKSKRMYHGYHRFDQ